MTDYYVSENGKNGNSGSAPGAPWRSIQKGIDALSAGDTLYIMAGTYVPGDEGEDRWLVKNKKGTASRGITIKNYNNQTVILDGEENGDSSGFPQTGTKLTSRSVDNYHYSWTGLLEIEHSTYVTVDGIQITNSLGVGINVEGNEKINFAAGKSSATCTDITIQNCRVHNTRQRNMHVKHAWGVTVKNSEVSFGSWAVDGGAGGISAQNGIYLYIDNNVIHQQAGEAIEVDSNRYDSRYVYVRNNVLFDVESPILIHATDHIICVGNFIYDTPQEQAAPKGLVKGGRSIVVTPAECDITSKDSSYVLVGHNIVVNRNTGIVVKSDDLSRPECSENAPGDLKHVYVINNTVVNCKERNYLMSNDTASDCVFKGNISVHSDPAKHVSTGNRGNVKGWDADYNLYSTNPSIVKNLSGPHDLNGVNPRLVDTTPPDKGKVTKQPQAGYYANFTLKDGYDDATGFRIKETSQCIDAAPTIQAPKAWPEMGDYLNWSYDFANSGINLKRTGHWDIGAHEFKSEQTITADFSARPTSGESPLTVSFKDESSSSSSITSRFWDFGDGIISTEKDPVHQYGQGQFTVSLRVTSSAGTDIKTKSNLIDVTAPTTPIIERVTEGLKVLYRFNEGAGDTIYDVSGIDLPLDLKISNPNAVNWLSQGLNIARSTVIVSSGPASKINNACRASNELTLEVWLKPRHKQQDGPARIITISKNMHSRNIMLGQGLWGTQPTDLYDLRLRTTERSANGMPSFSSPEGTVQRRKMHVVVTRQRNGRTRYYVDGVITAETNIPGDFSTWNPRFPLLLGNETTGDHPWRGEIYLVAMYERALKLNEVKQNFKAGTELMPALHESSAPLTTSFRRFVLVKNGTESTVSNGSVKAVAYGVEYPDRRCVLCANGQTSNMAIYQDVNAIIRTYGKQGLTVSWLD